MEIFSGTARLTEALLDRGLPCLPPIDVTLCAMVPESFDVVDADRWEFFMQLVFLGAIVYAHFGTPCNTFSAARKEDGGPPPLRDVHHPDGLPSLTGDLWFTTFLGNLFRDRTCEACFVLVLLGADFSIENPLSSLIWETPLMISLLCRARAFVCDFDQCAFGAPSQKPTRVMVTHQLLQKALFRRCPGLSSTHRHDVLKGKVYSAQFGRVVYRTKLAQVYPHDMCQAMASAVAMMVQDPWSHLSPSFQLKGKANDRKRPLGQEVAWKMHRQYKTALAAVAAGYQLKRGAMKPLLEVECEPGQAIEWVMKIPHPFSVTDPLHEPLRRAILQVAASPDQVVRQRQDLIRHWHAIAVKSLQMSDRELKQISDPFLRQLLRGVPDQTPAQLGKTCNVELYRAMLAQCDSVDRDLPKLLLQGFPIVGEIARSQRWPAYEKSQDVVSLETLHEKAWDIRRKIVSRVQGVKECPFLRTWSSCGNPPWKMFKKDPVLDRSVQNRRFRTS